jgi:uncharacterized protein involved in exopolysaccharide biosynthesis
MSTTNNTVPLESPSLTETLLRIINNDLLHWKLCLLIVLVPTLIAFVCVMWVIKPTYRATAVVTPPASTSAMGALSGLVGGEMSSYASLLGLSSGSDDADAIWTFLNSWELHDQVITQFDLAKHYKFKGHFHADLLKQFRRNFSVTQTKEYMLQITVEDEDYKLASDIVAFILVKADSMYNAFKTEQASQARQYFETRIDTCLFVLDSLEDDFTKFQVKNNFYSPDIQLESTIKYLSGQQAEREAIGVEMDYEKMNRGSESKRYDELSKRYKSLNTSLQQTLNGRESKMGLIALKKSPGLAAEYLRKEAELKVQESLYKLLRQQSEQMQLEEAKRLTNLHVLEAPWPNDKKVSPRRGLLLTFTFCVSLLFATLICNFLAYLDGEKVRDTRVATEWNRLVLFFCRKKA